MPNPYDDLFDKPDSQAGDPKDQKMPVNKAEESIQPLADLEFNDPGPEPLEEILDNIAAFNQRAERFSRMLSELRVIDHKVSNPVTKIFLVTKDPHNRGSLEGERQYHALQEQKFRLIIEPMRELGTLHLAIVRQFNRDIDENYYSVEKSDAEIRSDKARAIDGLNLQRRILADAAESLLVLADGLEDTEKRLSNYVNAGGENNISRAELELLTRKREQLTSGVEHNFDYRFFDANLFDKTAISMGFYMKETSSQYLSKLIRAVGS
jgi:hypothetical protein